MPEVATLTVNPDFLPAPGRSCPGAAHAPGAGDRSAGGGCGGGADAGAPGRMACAVCQSGRQGRRRHRGAVVHHERALQILPKAAARSWCRPTACTTPACAWRSLGLAQRLGGRLRDDGVQPLWHDAVPGAADLPARPGRGVDPVDPGPVVGAERPGPPGLAQPERVFPRAAKAVCVGAVEPAPGAHAGSRPAGGHCASGGLQRSGAGAGCGQCADDTGKLLSTPADGSGWRRGVDAEQLQYVQQLEQLYTQRILDILEPVVGRKNVKAQVTAEVDFSQTESTTESHRPNQTPDSSAVRSQQVVESTNGGGAGRPADGVPGATTNQPPGGAAPGQRTGAGAWLRPSGRRRVQRRVKRESIINYEVDKTVRVVRGSTGLVKRISAAVVLNTRP
jgi:hypothetical protein